MRAISVSYVSFALRILPSAATVPNLRSELSDIPTVSSFSMPTLTRDSRGSGGDCDHGAQLRCMTIDVEECFHIEAARRTVPRSDWGLWPRRAPLCTQWLLELLDRHACRATFFFLGDVARDDPQLARRVSEAGHEVASHGMFHERLDRLDARSFKRDLVSSRKLLEDQTGAPVYGYRAPSFSLVHRTAWAIDVLLEAGFQYDASIFPVRHPSYGVRSAPDHPFWVQHGTAGATILEVPPLTWTWRGSGRMAVAGGAYLRLLPLCFAKCGLAQAAAAGRPAGLYCHPWEIDKNMPRMPLPWLQRVRTYGGVSRTEQKLGNLLCLGGEWCPIRDALPHMRRLAERSAVLTLGSGAAVEVTTEEPPTRLAA